MYNYVKDNVRAIWTRLSPPALTYDFPSSKTRPATWKRHSFWRKLSMAVIHIRVVLIKIDMLACEILQLI